MRIVKQKDGTYELHFSGKGNSVYPTFGGYESIDAAKDLVRKVHYGHVVFIHLLPHTWWVVKF